MKKVMSTFMVALVSGLTMLAADSPKYGLLKGRILDNEKNPLAGAVVVIDSDKQSLTLTAFSRLPICHQATTVLR